MNAFITRLLRRTVLLGVIAALAIVPLRSATADSSARSRDKPTIVLVHGAWADASSWNGVIARLRDDGYKTVAVPNPLRSLSADSAYVAEFLRSVPGPKIVVGHSYGSAVITNAAKGIRDVRALVYVNGAVPREGENVLAAVGTDSALADPDPTDDFRYVPANRPLGAGTDLYLKPRVFFGDFARGLPRDQAALLAATQRPVTFGALTESSGPPAWKDIPSWYLIGTLDRIIPAQDQREMAAKAGSRIFSFRAGHLGLLSDPKAVVKVIEEAASARS
jgi:pimeloyl-ACP methyl ester carboxylesterase